MRHDLQHGTGNMNRPTHGGLSHGPSQKLSHAQRYTDLSKNYQKLSKLSKLSQGSHDNHDLFTGAHRGDSHIKLVPARQRNAKHIHPVSQSSNNSRDFNPMAFRFGLNSERTRRVFGAPLFYENPIVNKAKRSHGRPRWAPKLKE